MLFPVLMWLALISVVFCLLAVNWAGVATWVQVPLTAAKIELGTLASTVSVAGFAITVPWLYMAFVFIMVAGMSNAVNLTDGLDGLAAGTVTIVMLAYAGIAFRQDSLETALFGTPLAVVYRVGWLNHAIARRVIRLSHIGLPNIVAGAEVAPELLQNHAPVVERRSVARCDRQRLVVARQRILVALQIPQQVAAVIERVDKVRPDRERPVITCQRLLVTVQRPQHGAMDREGFR